MRFNLYCSRPMVAFLLCVCIFFANVTTVQPTIIETMKTGTPQNSNEVIPYLQSELASCSSAQQQILTFLHGKGIPVGLGPASLRKVRNIAESLRSRITVSTSDNGVECRIALGTAPVGAKCVAPCGCSGSQKWVQFAELNRLRRKDPAQWTVCRTCQQKFDYSVFEAYGGLPGNIIGYILDHKPMLRAFIAAAGAVALYLLNAPLWVSRALTSHLLWQQVSNLYRKPITHIHAYTYIVAHFSATGHVICNLHYISLTWIMCTICSFHSGPS